MRRMNLDRLIIGILLGICLMLALGAGGDEEANPPGTYQIEAGTNYTAYVLNTRTGEYWEFRPGSDVSGPRQIPNK